MFLKPKNNTVKLEIFFPNKIAFLILQNCKIRIMNIRKTNTKLYKRRIKVAPSLNKLKNVIM